MNWIRSSLIGRGATASVSLARDRRSGELFAVKSTELSASGSLRAEQSLLEKLDSPYIVKYRGFDITEENDKLLYNVFMEYFPRGSLSDLIQGRRAKESEIKSYTYDILRGLEYLHGQEIVHGDIKSSNVLIGEEGVKICDLGCAKLAGKRSDSGDSGAIVFSGTPLFMAPEVILGVGQGFESDIWSLGCTVVELATGRTPWPGVTDPFSALYRIGISGDTPEIPHWLSHQGKDFLGACFRRDPRKRPTASELLKHPFFDRRDGVVEEDSPRSVCDSFAVFESSGNRYEDEEACSSSGSAAERIGGLIGRGDLGWSLDDDWMTVRSVNYQISDVIIANEPSLGVNLEEFSTKSSAFDFVEENSIIVFRSLEFKKKIENLYSLQYFSFLNFVINQLTRKITNKTKTNKKKNYL